MGPNVNAAFKLAQHLLHRIAHFAFAALAGFLVLSCILSAAGYWPWLEIYMSFGARPIENAGVYVQIASAVLAVMLLFFLPATGRMMALENSHRKFHLGIEDVARAYHHAHAADRGSLFRLSPEFDAMRERLAYLRAHPDLGSLEPEIMEIAAQMSFISRDLAKVYSDENVGRARGFLRQRQQEVDRFNKRLAAARAIHLELKHWLTQVELDESVASSQLETLRDELYAVMPELAVEVRNRRKVIGLPRAAE